MKLLNSAKFPRTLSSLSGKIKSFPTLSTALEYHIFDCSGSNRLALDNRGSNQVEASRLQQKMDDLDQEERELDLRLKV